MRNVVMLACGAGLLALTSLGPAVAAGPVFPTGVDPKYSKETPARARLKTCSAQYKINKAKDANGGLPWIKKGGGYWSECNKKLKG